MSIPFSDPKRATTDVVVTLSRSRVSPTLPFELKDHVPPNTWAARVSKLDQLASQYCRPTFERAYLAVALTLSFLVPVTAYYATLQTLDSTEPSVTDRQVWLVRLASFLVAVATLVVLSAPIVGWKYLGKVRVARLAERWTKADALAAADYGVSPVWKAGAPGLFRDAILLTVTVPVIRKSHFDPDGSLPPYIAAGDGALPPYWHLDNWSKDPAGGFRYGDLPIYDDDKSTLVHV